MDKIVDEISQDRRRFFGTAAMAVAATQLGMIGPAAAQRVRAKMPASWSEQDDVSNVKPSGETLRSRSYDGARHGKSCI
jgi:nitrous oxide reductase